MVETTELESSVPDWLGGEVGAEDYEDYDDFEPDEDYFREEHWRVLDLAAEEMDSAAVPPVVYGLALKHRADSIEVKGEPDWEYEDGEYVSSPGSYREVFRVSPARAVAEGWRLFRTIVSGFRLPASPHRQRGRSPRRVVRIARHRRKTATRGSPGRSSGGDDPLPPHPHVADPRLTGRAA
jgi:hypothetical protein